MVKKRHDNSNNLFAHYVITLIDVASLGVPDTVSSHKYPSRKSLDEPHISHVSKVYWVRQFVGTSCIPSSIR